MNIGGYGQNSLWMGDLDAHMDELHLRTLFAGLGYHIATVRMIRDRISGKPAGYCFLEFQDEMTAQSALMNLNLKPWPGTNKVLKLNWAQSNKSNTQEHSVYVGELSYEVTDEALYKFFAANLPSCRSAKIVCETSGKSKGFGFVRFGNEEDAQRAIREFNLTTGLGDRRLRVCKAFPKQPDTRVGMPANQWPGYYPGVDPWNQYQAYNQSLYQQQLSDANELEPYDDGLTVDEMNREYLDHEKEFSELVESTRWQLFDNVNCTRPVEMFS